MFVYNVKFICGKAASKEFIVSPGVYTTEINILNFSDKPAKILKLFIPVVIKDRAIAREPNFQKPMAEEKMVLPPDCATMDDCMKITSMLGTGTSLKIGFLKIQSSMELSVVAVYTVFSNKTQSVSLDVENIVGHRV